MKTNMKRSLAILATISLTTLAGCSLGGSPVQQDASVVRSTKELSSPSVYLPQEVAGEAQVPQSHEPGFAQGSHVAAPNSPSAEVGRAHVVGFEEVRPSSSVPSGFRSEKATGLSRPRKVEHADEATFADQVLHADVPVLVDFYADWCGPCRALSPTLEELAQEEPHAKVVKVNIDDSPDLAAKYGVRSIPSVKVFKQGSVVAEHQGLADKRRLKALLAK